ncbi:hypothetical protein A4A71_03510 [Nicoletella semolina]|nr:hypothetical protein [Nicoletella semolina]
MIDQSLICEQKCSDMCKTGQVYHRIQNFPTIKYLNDKSEMEWRNENSLPIRREGEGKGSRSTSFFIYNL